MIYAPLRTKAVLAIYLVTGAVSMILGVVYFSAQEFMSYHSEAVRAPWLEVDSSIQTLILALMKVAGGGWFVLGFIAIILAFVAFKTGNAIVRWTIPVGTIIFYLASFTATWGVYQETGAPTPWGQSLVMIGFMLLALVIDAPWSTRVRSAR